MKNLTFWGIIHKAITGDPGTLAMVEKRCQPQPVSPWSYLFEPYYTKSSVAGSWRQWPHAPHTNVLPLSLSPIACHRRPR